MCGKTHLLYAENVGIIHRMIALKQRIMLTPGAIITEELSAGMPVEVLPGVVRHTAVSMGTD